MAEERPVFWFAPTWPAPSSGEIDADDDWDSGLVNFGLADISDIPARYPGAVALEAHDLDEARIEVARIWEAVGSQESAGRLPDGYWILDTEGFILAQR